MGIGQAQEMAVAPRGEGQPVLVSTLGGWRPAWARPRQVRGRPLLSGAASSHRGRTVDGLEGEPVCPSLPRGRCPCLRGGRRGAVCGEGHTGHAGRQADRVLCSLDHHPKIQSGERGVQVLALPKTKCLFLSLFIFC